jgi:hypothetical protein
LKVEVWEGDAGIGAGRRAQAGRCAGLPHCARLLQDEAEGEICTSEAHLSVVVCRPAGSLHALENGPSKVQFNNFKREMA